MVKAALKESGREEAVAWNGAKAEARYGPFASIVNAKGEITDDVITLEKCGGVAGSLVLGKCRELLERLFPGGEQAR
jgi:hypothetical protein